MRNIYIILILLLLILVVMIALAFFYLDQQRHQIFLYGLYRDDTLVGYEKIDRYLLENRLIYKSSSQLARDILHRKTTMKMTFDVRGKNLIDYTKDVSSNGAESTEYLLSNPEKISFMVTGHGDFLYIEGVPTYGNDLPFENGAIVTYLPLVRRYNFKKHGEQFVNVLTPISTFLPPVRQTVSLTSIGRDSIEIEGRIINCERLVLELKNGDLISVWISRRFHNILMVEIPKYGAKAIFCTEKKNIPVQEYKRKSSLYIEKEVTFNNGDTVLYGTITVPTTGEAPYPAVMLIWDSGPLDRESLGLFTDVAHTFAEAGYCVLRFDKRGIGQSQGFFSTYVQLEEISDLKCAFDFLKSLPEADKSRMALLGHSEGGFFAAYLAGTDKDVRACIIMSALSSLSPLKGECSKLRKFITRIVSDDEEYLESTIAAIKETRGIIKDKGDWATVLGKRVFTKKIDSEEAYNVLDAMKKVNVPILILHGRRDTINPVEEARELEDALAEGGNEDITTIHFGRLDHFFGTVVKNSPIRDHIEVDIEVLKSITTWLDKNLIPPPVKIPTEPTSIIEEMGVEELQGSLDKKPLPPQEPADKIIKP